MATLTVTPVYFDLTGQYPAASFRTTWRDILFEGVVQPNDFLVVPKGGTAANPDAGGASRNLSVDTLTGVAWVTGDDAPTTQGIYRCFNGGTINDTVTSNSSGSTRIDSVILEIIDTPTNIGRTRIIAGTPGGGAPTIPNNCFELSRITVTNGLTQVIGSSLTDQRTRATTRSYTSFPASNVTLTASVWTDICSVTLNLPRAARIRVAAKARVSSTAAGTPAVAVATYNATATTMIARTGTFVLPGTGTAFLNDIPLYLNDMVDLPSGSSTITLQAYKDANGSAQVNGGTAALQGYTDCPSRLWVEVVG